MPSVQPMEHSAAIVVEKNIGITHAFPGPHQDIISEKETTTGAGIQVYMTDTD